jgi:hypothetical protein
MVTPMTEQSGPSDPSDRQGSERQGSERQGSEGQGSERQGSERQGTERQVPEPPGRRRPGTDRPWQSPPPRPDLIGDLNRWLIRQGAKNVRKEIGGQVRRTFGGGRSAPADVWDTVTNEIPPVEGEAPECQWCPICRAARRMRESGPGIGGQLSGAGDAVASAVQDAFNALDGLLSKTGGGNAQRDTEPQRTGPHGTGPHGTVPPETWPHGAEPHGTVPPETGPHGTLPPATGPHGTLPPATGPHGTGPQETARRESVGDADTDRSRGPAGWHTAADPWSTATEADVPEPADSEPAPSVADARDAEPLDAESLDAESPDAGPLDAEAPHVNSDPGPQHDGRGHEPDDRS